MAQHIQHAAGHSDPPHAPGHGGEQERRGRGHGPEHGGKSEKEVLKKIEDKWDADRRAETGKDKDDGKNSGEGSTDAKEVSEATERNAYQAGMSGKSTKEVAKVMKVEHKEQGEKIRDDAEKEFSRHDEEGALGGGRAGGGAGVGARGGGRSRRQGKGKGKRKSREQSGKKQERTRNRTRMEDLSYQQRQERLAYAGSGIFSDPEGSDGDDDDDDETSEDEDAQTRRLNDQETELASGRAGCATREGKEGGARKRKVPPLSYGGDGDVEATVAGYLGELMEDRREDRARRATAAGGASYSGGGGGVTQADLAALEKRVTSAVGDTVTRAISAALRLGGGGSGVPQQFQA
eukprot:g10943.t1